MGWFGFGGSRERDHRSRADARGNKNAADARGNKSNKKQKGARVTYEAVCIDRAGKPSRLPEDRPRRRDYEDRWSRR